MIFFFLILCSDLECILYENRFLVNYNQIDEFEITRVQKAISSGTICSSPIAIAPPDTIYCTPNPVAPPSASPCQLQLQLAPPLPLPQKFLDSAFCIPQSLCKAIEVRVKGPWSSQNTQNAVSLSLSLPSLIRKQTAIIPNDPRL